MIIKSCVLEKGKVCPTPKRYYPNQCVFDKYAGYYQKDSEELYAEIKASVEEAPEEEDMSSEEKEDNEIKATDRLAVALVNEDNEQRLDVYLYAENIEAFYMHHDIFLHGNPTSIAVLDREDDPFVFISNEDGTISGYNLYVMNHFLPDTAIDAHSLPIIQIESCGNLLVSIDKNVIKGWDMVAQKNLFISEDINPLKISLDAERIVYTDKKTVYIYDEREGKSAKIFSTESPITSVETKESLIAAGTESGKIFYMKGASRAQLRKSEHHTEAINSIIIPTDRYIGAASEDGSISLFDTDNQEIVLREETRADMLIIAAPKDDPSLFVYSLEDNELGIGFYEKELFS